MATVKGYCDPKFDKVKRLLENDIASGEELGASIAINVDGYQAVNLHGGFVDEAKTKPWSDDTIVNIWSSTKPVTGLAVLMLHDRGLLDVNENVAKYWPEFAANGKENIKVRHILSHTSGVSGWEQPVTWEDLYDAKASAERLATQPPWWEPGTASGYHITAFGHLLGELVRRVSGKTLTQFVADEIAGPLGADFQIGAKESDWRRITDVIPPPPPPGDLSNMDPASVGVKTATGPALNAVLANTSEWRNAELGAVNGHTNALGLCKILAVVSRGGSVDGKRFLSQKTIDLIFEQQADGVDMVMGRPITIGIGYGIAGNGTAQSMPYLPQGDNRRVCFWGGWGGSWELMDVDKRVTLTYVMNKMEAGVLGSDRAVAYFNAIFEALG
jgi:CubicO group peptidase (beta-lactamase class C family)